jgi:hypothetical protein
MDGARREGLRAAADVLARIMQVVAMPKTRMTAAAVNVIADGEDVLVRGGRPGRWGWTPIQGSMLDNNRRHPLFGNRAHWYNEGYYGITEMTVDYGADDAAEAYADAAVDLMLREHGILE